MVGGNGNFSWNSVGLGASQGNKKDVKPLANVWECSGGWRVRVKTEEFLKRIWLILWPWRKSSGPGEG